MKPFKRHKTDGIKHPLVRQLFAAMNERRISKTDMSRLSGVEYSSFASWQHRGYRPHLDNLDACLQVLGCELVIRKRTG